MGFETMDQVDDGNVVFWYRVLSCKVLQIVRTRSVSSIHGRSFRIPPYLISYLTRIPVASIRFFS